VLQAYSFLFFDPPVIVIIKNLPALLSIRPGGSTFIEVKQVFFPELGFANMGESHSAITIHLQVDLLYK
jgi:hypothetical protein